MLHLTITTGCSRFLTEPARVPDPTCKLPEFLYFHTTYFIYISGTCLLMGAPRHPPSFHCRLYTSVSIAFPLAGLHYETWDDKLQVSVVAGDESDFIRV